MNDYEDARLKKIIRPQVSRKPFPVWCNDKSPVWVRRPIIQLRRYLAIECDYGFSWDMSDEGWKNTEIRTFTDNEHHWLIGYAAFDTEAATYLSSAWIHPFYRNRGFLKSAWKELVARFGHFDVDMPNKAMSAFLRDNHMQAT